MSVYHTWEYRWVVIDFSTGQSHLMKPIQNALEIVVIPTSLKTLGMNANPSRWFLTEQIQTNVA